MRQIKVAEFIYILNGYNGYIWDFCDYLVEWYRRDKTNELWQIYIAKCVSAGIDKSVLPDYASLLKQMQQGNVERQETSEQIITRLITKINKANGGGSDEFV